MSIVQYLAIAATLYCIVSLLVHFVKIVRLGAPKDKSEPSGSVKEGVIYANTRAMMPTEKESAYLHIPSYAVGMLFHIGLFCSLLFFVLSFFPFFNNWIGGSCWRWVLAIPPAVATVCGLILFFRRLFSKDLKVLSMPDDFISTGLVTLFLLMTTFYLSMSTCCGSITILYYISSILLLLYMPLGKLRHVVYYFAARYHLGFFYGWRNVWPNHEKK
jgi:hypothetical protein